MGSFTLPDKKNAFYFSQAMYPLKLLSLLLLLASCVKAVQERPGDSPSPMPDNDHLLLGNPTNATDNPVSTTNFLKKNNGYVVGYDADAGIPRWVSWHLDHTDLGDATRNDVFSPDNLPAGYYRVTHASYTNSGFDRGHNCPSADRTRSGAYNAATFLMTNIAPQAPSLNRNAWAGLEEYIRALLDTRYEAYIVMGNFGRGGRGSAGEAISIDNDRVRIPAVFWKVAVIIPKGDNDLSRIDTAARVLAVRMPNDELLAAGIGKSGWKNYTTTLLDIERDATQSGRAVNFLTNVKEDIRSYLLRKPSIK